MPLLYKSKWKNSPSSFDMTLYIEVVFTLNIVSSCKYVQHLEKKATVMYSVILSDDFSNKAKLGQILPLSQIIFP